MASASEFEEKKYQKLLSEYKEHINKDDANAALTNINARQKMLDEYKGSKSTKYEIGSGRKKKIQIAQAKRNITDQLTEVSLLQAKIAEENVIEQATALGNTPVERKIKTKQIGIPMEAFYSNMSLNKLKERTNKEKEKYPIIKERIKKLETLEKAQSKRDVEKAIEEIKKGEIKEIGKDLAVPMEYSDVVKKYNQAPNSYANTEFLKKFKYDYTNPLIQNDLRARDNIERKAKTIKFVPEVNITKKEDRDIYNMTTSKTLNEYKKYNNPPTEPRWVNDDRRVPFESAYPIGESGISYEAIKRLLGGF